MVGRPNPIGGRAHDVLQPALHLAGAPRRLIERRDIGEAAAEADDVDAGLLNWEMAADEGTADAADNNGFMLSIERRAR